MIQDQLAAAVEEIKERFLSAKAFKNVFLFDMYHRQPPPPRGKFVASAHVRLFFDEKVVASHLPFCDGDDPGQSFHALGFHFNISEGFAVASQAEPLAEGWCTADQIHAQTRQLPPDDQRHVQPMAVETQEQEATCQR